MATKARVKDVAKKVEDAVVSVDRRSERAGDRRKSEDRRKETQVVSVERRQGQRREKVSRRRQIDPTTCERDYSDAEVEFMNAMDLYKRKNGRMFPTCSEILEVIRDLGYAKLPSLPSTPIEVEAPATEATPAQ